MRLIRTFLAMCALSLAVGTVQAQSGGILVAVLDGEGSPLPGATVTISHETGSVKTTAQLTDKRGRVEFPVLRAGSGYSVLVEFPGFSPIRHADLRVSIGDELQLSVQMIEEVRERVRVQADREVISLDEPETSVKFSQDFIADLPVPGRFYQNVLTLAPGVQDADGDGNPNVHGSRERDFAAMVGGIRNVDPLTGQWMSRVNPNSIEELEVITAGAGVEFGRAQGGFARIIQKQGSNEHEGVFEFLYRSSKLDGAGAGLNSNVDDGAADAPDYEWLQPAFQVSGPILRDKLWYRLSHEYRQIQEPVNVGSRFELTTTTEWTHSDQLTWQVSPRNKLSFQYQSDPSEITSVGVSSLRPGEAAWNRERTGDSFLVRWTAPYSPRILVESLVGWQDLNFSRQPTTQGIPNDCVAGQDPFLENSQCRNVNTGVYSGSFYRTEDDRSQRLTVSGKTTLYTRFAGMSNQIKLGIGIENERYFRDLTQEPFGFLTTDFLAIPPIGDYQVRLSVPETGEVRATGTNWAIFAEDQFKPTQNLTITLGLRVDREEIESEGRSQFDPSAELQAYDEQLSPLIPALIYTEEPDLQLYQNIASTIFPEIFTGFEDYDVLLAQLQSTICDPEPPEERPACLLRVRNELLNSKHERLIHKRQGENLQIGNTNTSPFLALAWSPGSNGKTAVKFAAGRHYNAIPLIVPLQELEPILSELSYREDPQSGQFKIVDGIQPGITARTVDRDLETPYQDEFTLSIEREIWTETSISATYINRKFNAQIQDVNINFKPDDFGRCVPVGAGVFASPGAGFTLIDPYTGQRYEDTDPGNGDGRVDDCVREEGLGPDGADDLYVQNPFWADIFLVSNVNSIDYEAIVLELIRRQYRGWEMLASYTWSEAIGDGEDFFQEIGNDPSLQENVRGFQSYDQRHVVKLTSTSITPWGFRLGGSLTWQSGLPYSLLWERPSFDTVPPITGPNFPEGTNLVGVTSRTRQTYPTGVRNDQRNQSFWNLDLRAAKEFNLGRGVNMQISAEIFNVLDDQTYTVYNTFTKAGQNVNAINEAFNRFGRRWQLGMKINW